MYSIFDTENKKKLKKKSYILILATLFIAAIFFIFSYINKDFKKTQEIDVSKSFSADMITTNNDLSYFDNHIEKALHISGKIKNIENQHGKYTLILSSKNEKINIICKMQDDQIEKIKKLEIGTLQKIKGIYKGYLNDMILLNCVLN